MSHNSHYISNPSDILRVRHWRYLKRYFTMGPKRKRSTAAKLPKIGDWRDELAAAVDIQLKEGHYDPVALAHTFNWETAKYAEEVLKAALQAVQKRYLSKSTKKRSSAHRVRIQAALDFKFDESTAWMDHWATRSVDAAGNAWVATGAVGSVVAVRTASARIQNNLEWTNKRRRESDRDLNEEHTNCPEDAESPRT
ncbi:hypothetical protein BC832DRAFT_540317 [Gaertneriomyces semiglobifer]|nr:hypothetical protein BC832DRAFT_540317 [Gaertneriomyces semiglobifer]